MLIISFQNRCINIIMDCFYTGFTSCLIYSTCILVKSLRGVEAHDCSIEVSSNSNRAITFTFGQIPLNPASYVLNSTSTILL